MKIFLALLFVLGVITVLGHLCWLILAFLFRQLFGDSTPPPVSVEPPPAREERTCPGCTNRVPFGVRRCPGCGLDVAGPEAREVAELVVTLQQLDALLARQELEPKTVEEVRQRIVARRL